MPDPISSTPAGRPRRPGVAPPASVRQRRSRILLTGLPVLAVFTAFGAIVWLAYEDGTQGAPVGEPPLIKAEATPIKLPPTDATAEADGEGGVGADDGGVGQLWSDSATADQPERLLPPPEEPLTPEIALSDQGDAAGPSAESAGEVADGVGQAPTDVAESPQIAAVAPTDAERSAEPSSPETPAEPTPPARPEAEAALDRLLAEVAAAETNGGEPATTAPAEPEEVTAALQARPPSPSPGGAQAPAATTPAAPADPTVRPAIAATPTSPPATERPGPAPGGPVALVVPDEPVDRPTTAAPAAPTPPARVAAIDGDYRIQLAAVRAEADAQRAWDLFQVDLGPVLSGLQPFFERADTANGVFYRVQVGPLASEQEAETLCEELKQLNASCFVVRR